MNVNSSVNTGFRYEGLLFIPVLLGAILGIPGTILTARFYGQRIKKTSTSMALSLTALAIFDMITLVLNIPTGGTSLIKFYAVEWEASSEANFVAFFKGIPRYWSNMTLLLAASERVVCVVFPHKTKAICTRRFGIVAIVLIIIMGPIVLSPFCFNEELLVIPSSNDTIKYLQTQPITLIDPDVFKAIGVTGILLYLAVPVIGVLICNICFVSVMMYRFKSKTAKNTRITMTASQMKELRATKLVLIVTVIFLISASPMAIMYYLIVTMDNTVSMVFFLVIRPVCESLESLNYSLNFIVYYTGSRNFRMETRETMYRICHCCKPTRITPVFGIKR
ncbi:galanin receptor 2b-like [Argopecten irradians]|uniref:galanin receptor 2b-like n=1 Tax=Argopecten irradians TaxID=31199 RepID=UPI0037213B28